MSSTTTWAAPETRNSAFVAKSFSPCSGLTFRACRIVGIGMSGFDYYGAELQAFSDAIGQIERDIPLAIQRTRDAGTNLTYAAFAHRARANFVAASLVSLVEYRLYDIARELIPTFDAAQVRGWGGLKSCLKHPKCHSTNARLPRGRDVTRLKTWGKFEALREIRHPVVHGFGDIALARDETAARNALKLLRLKKQVLVGDRRICFTVPALSVALDIVRKLMAEIGAQDKATTR